MTPAMNPFGQLRKEVKQTKPELIASGTDFELTLSPAEKVRAEENLAFGKNTLKAFDRFTQHPEDISPDEIKHLAQDAMQGMAPAQQAVFERVTNRVVKNCEQVDEIYKQKGAELAERFFAFRIMAQQMAQRLNQAAKSELCRQIKKLPEQQTQEEPLRPESTLPRNLNLSQLDNFIPREPREKPQITATNFGSFVIRIKDPEDWQLLSEMDRSGMVGLKIRAQNPLFRQLMTQLGFIPDQIDLIGRMVFLADFPETHDQVEKVKTHELIHDLYDLAIKPETKTIYTRPLEKEIFLQVKDEILAYLAGNKYWNPDLTTLAGPIIAEACLDNPDNAQYSPWEVLGRLAKREREKQGEGAQGEAQAAMFHQSMRTALREIARLNLLDSKTYDKALPAILGAQSFKEIAYHLSRLEVKKSIDVVQVSLAPDSNQVDSMLLMHNLLVAIMYDLPVAGLERLEPSLFAMLRQLYEKYPDLEAAPPQDQMQYRLINEALGLMQRVQRIPEAIPKAA